MSSKTTKTQDPTTTKWEKGTSGNPAGRPPGSRNKSTVFFEELLEGQADELIAKAVESALKGEPTALRLCLDRIYPPRKERAIDLQLPDVSEPRYVSNALAAIVAAVGEGRITPGEGERMARLVETQIRGIEFDDVLSRISRLEKAQEMATKYAERQANPQQPNQHQTNQQQPNQQQPNQQQANQQQANQQQPNQQQPNQQQPNQQQPNQQQANQQQANQQQANQQQNHSPQVEAVAPVKVTEKAQPEGPAKVNGDPAKITPESPGKNAQPDDQAKPTEKTFAEFLEEYKIWRDQMARDEE